MTSLARRSLIVCAVLAACAMLLPRAATVSAHAVLVKATPAEGATVSGPNVHFELQFNSKVDAERSQLILSQGAQPAMTLYVTQGTSPAVIVADAAGLTAGEWTVSWQALAHDGHISRGSYKIHVK